MIRVAIGTKRLGTGRSEQVWVLAATTSTPIMTTFFVGGADVMSSTNNLWGMEISGY